MENQLEMKKTKKEKIERPQTTLEEIGNSITHGLGFIFGIVALILLLVKSNRPIEYFGALFYALSIMGLYIMSCLYHSFKHDTTTKRVFRRFDHLSIYLLIGGTFAPILLCELGGTKGWIFFGIQWFIIVVGIILKSIDPSKYTVFHIIMFLIMGWSGLIFLPQLLSSNPVLFWMILSGGLAYSVGVIFFIWDFKSAHFIWHFFVLFGTILHFIGIFGWIY